jgi:gamma-D-glutamyl-L-lysine dipeptidyl-peptidase
LAKLKNNITSDWLLCGLSLIPILAKPVENATLVTQLLFGETAVVLERKTKIWWRIVSHFDGTEGWVDSRQLTTISEKKFNEINSDYAVALEVCQVLMNDDLIFPILIGSSLPKFDGMTFKTEGTQFVYTGNANLFGKKLFSPEHFFKIAQRFTNAPYFKGGRSIFGLDSAALVQIVMKCAGIQLPRTIQGIYSKIEKTVDFQEQANAGDVAFFINKNEEVDHIGILLSNTEILHVNEKARIDRLDHEGIYNMSTKKYTHKLKVIATF